MLRFREFLSHGPVGGWVEIGLRESVRKCAF